MPPRFSPRDWIEPPEAFVEPDKGRWKKPTSAEGTIELMVAHYLSSACEVALEELRRRDMDRGDLGDLLGFDEDQTRRLRRKLNGEFPATLEDLFTWAAVLGRPDILFAPADVSDMLPPGVNIDEALELLPSTTT